MNEGGHGLTEAVALFRGEAAVVGVEAGQGLVRWQANSSSTHDAPGCWDFEMRENRGCLYVVRQSRAAGFVGVGLVHAARVAVGVRG
ncbi:hypothetical protein, partial [Streptomyces sp. NPDC006270]|uniref:hypothetical protein n=1 Tax=Streptomyces sp. NPDC006270 TaxID=3364741 RepID=UPI003677FAED